MCKLMPKPCLEHVKIYLLPSLKQVQFSQTNSKKIYLEFFTDSRKINNLKQNQISAGF